MQDYSPVLKKLCPAKHTRSPTTPRTVSKTISGMSTGEQTSFSHLRHNFDHEDITSYASISTAESQIRFII